MPRKYRLLAIAALLAAGTLVPAVACAHDVIPPIDSNCLDCHYGAPFPRQGAHGAYATTTTKCDDCHSIHAAGVDDGSGTKQSVKLLPGKTVSDACNFCHDGTGGTGVYGVLANRGITVEGRHRVETTSVIPGGDAASGGPASRTFRGKDGTLTCSDCHSPHGTDLVAAFKGERNRDGSNVFGVRSRLLKRSPTGAAAPVDEYGSDWCGACHAGRIARTPLHNHPVDSLASTTTPFTYGNAALIALMPTAGDPYYQEPTSAVAPGPMGGTNRGYLITYPRTSAQGEHAPICQQCHEDARNVGELQADPSIAYVRRFLDNQDGQNVLGNPRFQVFPHEAANPRMLVETENDLCLNCHPEPALP